MAFSHSDRKEVFDFFVGILGQYDDFVFYENLRSYLSKASPIVRKYVDRKCNGENLLEYFKRRKNYFVIENSNVALKTMILKRKRSRTRRNRGNSQNNSFSLEDAISAEAEPIPDLPLTREEEERQRAEEFAIKHFTRYLKKHKKVKVDWLSYEEQPITIKTILLDYYDRSIRYFFQNFPGDFLIDSEDCVSLRIAKTTPNVIEKDSKSSREPKPRKSSEYISPSLKKVTLSFESVNFFVESLHKKTLPYPVEKLNGCLSQASQNVRDHIKFKYKFISSFLKSFPTIFLINSHEQVSLTNECNEIICEIEKQLLLHQDAAILEEKINLLLKHRVKKDNDKSITKNSVVMKNEIINKTSDNKNEREKQTDSSYDAFKKNSEVEGCRSESHKLSNDKSSKSNSQDNNAKVFNSLVNLHDFVPYKKIKKESEVCNIIINNNAGSSLREEKMNSESLLEKNDKSNDHSLFNEEFIHYENSQKMELIQYDNFQNNFVNENNIRDSSELLHSTSSKEEVDHVFKESLNFHQSNELSSSIYGMTKTDNGQIMQSVNSESTNFRKLEYCSDNPNLASNINNETSLVFRENKISTRELNSPLTNNIHLLTFEKNSIESNFQKTEKETVGGLDDKSKLFTDTSFSSCDKMIPDETESELNDPLYSNIHLLLVDSDSEEYCYEKSDDSNDCLKDNLKQHSSINSTSFKLESSEERSHSSLSTESKVVESLSGNGHLQSLDSKLNNFNYGNSIEDKSNHANGSSNLNIDVSLFTNEKKIPFGIDGNLTIKESVINPLTDNIPLISVESNENKSNCANLSEDKEETSQKTPKFSTSRKKFDSGYDEDILVNFEKNAKEHCDKTNSCSSQDESSDSALGPIRDKISQKSETASLSDSETTYENEKIKLFEIESDCEEHTDERKVSDIEMYVKKICIPNQENFEIPKQDQFDEYFEFARVLSHDESEISNMSSKENLENSILTNNEIENSEYHAVGENSELCSRSLTGNIQNRSQKLDITINNVGQDIISEVSDKENKSFFTKAILKNDSSSTLKMKAAPEEHTNDFDRHLVYPLQPLVAEIVLLTTDSCLAQTIIDSRTQAIYFLKSVFSCDRHDSCTKCFDSLAIGDEVSCFVPLSEISHKTWVAFMVSKENSIKHERILSVNELLNKQKENDFTLYKESVHLKSDSSIKISNNIPEFNFDSEIENCDSNFTDCHLTTGSTRFTMDNGRKVFQHKPQFPLNCNRNFSFATESNSGSRITKETVLKELAADCQKCNEGHCCKFDLMHTSVQTEISEAACQLLCNNNCVDKVDVACQTACHNQDASLQAKPLSRDLGCQAVDSCHHSSSVSTFSQTDNASLITVQCQTELTGDVKAITKTVSSYCQTFSTGQIMITEYYHH